MGNQEQDTVAIMKFNHRAFTLVELLAVIIILGIIFALAIPKVQDVLANNKMKTARITYEKIVEIAKIKYAELGQPSYLKIRVDPYKKLYYCDDDCVTKGYIDYDGDAFLEYDRSSYNSSNLYLEINPDGRIYGRYFTNSICLYQDYDEIESYINEYKDWKECYNNLPRG